MEDNKNNLEDEVQKIIDEMNQEADAALQIYESRPDKENTVRPLAFGEACGFNKALRQYVTKLKTLLVRTNSL